MNFTPTEQRVFSLKPGDVLVTEGSGSLSAVGASAVWNDEIEGPVCFQHTLLRLRPRPGTHGRYLAWWCRFAFADRIFASSAAGANIFNLSAERVRELPMASIPLHSQTAVDFWNWDLFGSIRIPVADVSQQRGIARDIVRVQELMEIVRRSVALARERRQALITAAVTGDLDIPGAAA